MSASGRGEDPLVRYGMDMSALATLGQGPGVTARRWPPTHLRSMRKLTVAAINGGCAGVGFVQALCCDVRLAAEEARLSCAFTRRGAPAEYGASWLLPRLIGLADATDPQARSRRGIAGFPEETARAVRAAARALPAAELKLASAAGRHVLRSRVARQAEQALGHDVQVDLACPAVDRLGAAEQVGALERVQLVIVADDLGRGAEQVHLKVA